MTPLSCHDLPQFSDPQYPGQWRVSIVNTALSSVHHSHVLDNLAQGSAYQMEVLRLLLSLLLPLLFLVFLLILSLLLDLVLLLLHCS